MDTKQLLQELLDCSELNMDDLEPETRKLIRQCQEHLGQYHYECYNCLVPFVTTKPQNTRKHFCSYRCCADKYGV